MLKVVLVLPIEDDTLLVPKKELQETPRTVAEA
jgi:hypothetical protein